MNDLLSTRSPIRSSGSERSAYTNHATFSCDANVVSTERKKGTCEKRKCLIFFAGGARFERATFGSGGRKNAFRQLGVSQRLFSNGAARRDQS
jgi:hypothetical protein